MRRFRLAVLLAVAFGWTACGGAREAVEVDPTTLHGHRYLEATAEGRTTLSLVPPDPEEEYFVYPTIVWNIMVRPGPVLPDGRRPVEFVIIGALPDGCLQLHDFRMRRMGNHFDATFEMRRPKGGDCPRVVRRYRFYYELPEPLAPGPYVLRLNDDVYPFEVLPERTERG